MTENRRLLKALLASALSLALCVSFCGVSPAAGAEPASSDADLTAGRWMELAARYENPYASDGAPEALNVDVPPGESPDTGMSSQDNLSAWWKSLDDETLTKLIEWSLLNNRDLAQARSKVRESRASLGIAKSALLPWLDSSNTWTKSDTSENSTSRGQELEISHLGIDASWEIDIFGGRHQDMAAGAATLEADYAALHAAWVSLSSEVALNYLSLRTLQERLSVAEQNLALQTETLSLLESRHAAGFVDSLALNQERYTIEQTKAAIPPMRASIEATMNALSILTGSLPGSLEEMLAPRKPLPGLDGANLTGIPANSLRQRPDIRAAERRLTAQLARIKSAEADRYPRFYLAGSIGLESLTGGSLFSGDSFGYSFGPRVTLPIFHGRAIRSNIEIQRERAEQLLAAYENTVLSAAAEVRDALAASAQEMARNASLRAGAEAAHAALVVAQDKYNNGLTDFGSVITSQQALLSFVEAVAVSNGQTVSNVVRVYKAMGGGWAPIAQETSGEAEARR
ncbi:MAG: TolC family protein [Synergistaceae bacterium]|jgi:NodT family efflux transporter outer membrane factor (OMF) lipoprotein|nr:TolC family protein [Synergistaceae bacterium]